MGDGLGEAVAGPPFSAAGAKLIGCATVIEELAPIVPPGLAVEIFDFGLHTRPDGLRAALQRAIDDSAPEHGVMLLGYGLCSLAVVGLEAGGRTLAIPRVDDCIAAFVGGQARYRELNRSEPGTYYLTKGWIEAGDTLLDTHRAMVERYGRERADRVMATMLRHYRRVVYLDTGHDDQGRHRAYARRVAEAFSLGFDEVPGSLALVAKLLHGPWDDEILVVPPGGVVTYADFGTTSRTTANAGLTGGTPVDLSRD